MLRAVNLQLGGDDGHHCFVELVGNVGAVVEDQLLHEPKLGLPRLLQTPIQLLQLAQPIQLLLLVARGLADRRLPLLLPFLLPFLLPLLILLFLGRLGKQLCCTHLRPLKYLLRGTALGLSLGVVPPLRLVPAVLGMGDEGEGGNAGG